MTQVGAWYNVCSVTKEDYCPRQELLDMDRDPAIQVFKDAALCEASCQRKKTENVRVTATPHCPVNGQDEMEEVFVQMDSFCTGSGRAAELGCNVQRLIRRPQESRKEESLEVLR